MIMTLFYSIVKTHLYFIEMSNCFDLQTRRSEIILVLFIDMFYFNVYPDALKGLGYGKLHTVHVTFLFNFVKSILTSINFTIYLNISAIVLISVVGMAAANDLQKWMDKKFKSQPEVQS